jgi:PIN domain nuclease of toxin-antitoxin system
MSQQVRLDTHVVVWLYAGLVERFSPTAHVTLEQRDLVVAPMVELELTLLHEIGRLSVSGTEILGDLHHRVGLRVSDVPWPAAVRAAAGLTWTRDPFDRLIVADALAAGTSLLTRDDRVRERVPSAMW